MIYPYMPCDAANLGTRAVYVVAREHVLQRVFGNTTLGALCWAHAKPWMNTQPAQTSTMSILGMHGHGLGC